jgi:hypothetical protein
MVSNFFNPQEIPYDILKEYGVTEKMIEDLPEGIKQRFLSGKETAPLELILEDNGDEQKTFFAKISLVRKDDDSIDVMFHPEMNTIDLDSFAGKNAKLLREGKVVHTGDIVAQYDYAIDQIITMPFILVRHNIEVLQDNMSLSAQQCRDLSSGLVVEINRDNQTCSIGLDLTEDNAIRTSKGNAQQWASEAKLNKLDKYSFGLYGCWVSDTKGNMIRAAFIKQNNIHNQQKSY